MKNILNFLSLVLLLAFGANAQNSQVATLNVGSTGTYTPPAGVVLSVNGQTYIMDSQNTTTRTIKNEYLNEFLMYVEKGVIAEDLAIGGANIWLADYVFENDYKLPTLNETKDYVEKHKHLPGVMGQEELDQKGYYRINEMLIGQLKNIEELLLHTIAQEKQIESLKIENEDLKLMANEMEAKLGKLMESKQDD